MIENSMELQKLVAQAVYRNLLLPGASSVRLEFRDTPVRSETAAWSVGDDGLETSIRVNFDVEEILKELRGAMHEPGNGVWFSFSLTVSRNGSYEFDFNYDDEPKWWTTPHDLTLIEDLEKYPRPVDRIPLWHPGHPKNRE